MGSNFVNKMWKILGVENDDEEYEEDYDVNEAPVEDRDYNTGSGFGFNKKNNNKVVGMPGVPQVRVIISQPNSFEQSEEICEHLKEKKSIIVNLEYVNKDVARRIIDFISGAVYSLDGNIQKISNSIFLVAPYNYEITNETSKEDIKNKVSVSWIK